MIEIQMWRSRIGTSTYALYTLCLFVQYRFVYHSTQVAAPQSIHILYKAHLIVQSSSQSLLVRGQGTLLQHAASVKDGRQQSHW